MTPRGPLRAARRLQLAGLCVTLTMTKGARAETPAGLFGIASVIPGLGQTLQGEYLAGAGYFGSYLALVIAGGSLSARGRVQGSEFALHAADDLWFYNMYGAYKDAAKIKGQNLAENFLGAYDVTYALHPEVFAPLGIENGLLSMTPRAQAGDADATFEDGHTVAGRRYSTRSKALGVAALTSLTFHAMTGTGEEALFRGFIQQSLERSVGTVAGITTASLLFGAAHYPDGGFPHALEATLFGAYVGTVTHYNHYDLREMIFLHALWDTSIDVWSWTRGHRSLAKLTLPTIYF